MLAKIERLQAKLKDLKVAQNGLQKKISEAESKNKKMIEMVDPSTSRQPYN